MKTTIGNYLTQPNNDFPFDCQMLQHIQDNAFMTAMIGNIAGDKTILWGCESQQNGAYRKEGYVFVHTIDFPEGEILFWEGGETGKGMYLKKETESVYSQGFEYPEAYTIRSLAPGEGPEQEKALAAEPENEDSDEVTTEVIWETFSWDDFSEIKTNRELKDAIESHDTRIEKLNPPPLGIVTIWSGSATNLPANHVLCDGRALNRTDYPELYQVIGDLHRTTATTTQFNLPDLTGRFVVGYKSGDSDHGAIARKGGSKTVSLSVSNLPSHVHSVRDYYYIEGFSYGGYSGNERLNRTYEGSARTDADNNYMYYRTHDTASTGGGAAHQNLPPYYTLAYIMRVK